MAYDTTTDGASISVDGHWLRKYLTVGKMKEIFSFFLRDDDELAVNQVGNLSIFRPTKELQEDGEPYFEQIGYLDMGSEEFVRIERGEE